jgi:hypothetical protein
LFTSGEENVNKENSPAAGFFLALQPVELSGFCSSLLLRELGTLCPAAQRLWVPLPPPFVDTLAKPSWKEKYLVISTNWEFLRVF